ncbi:monooxygenase, partial [Pseudomonas syringae]|nr:monooxygenase [Pseudomonas syringae]
PDHKLFESHPLLNTQLLHYLQHGDIQVKADVSHYEGHEVVFKDGTREVLDLVLYATGYKWSCKYASKYFEWKGGRPQLYLSIFSREHHNLFGIGYLETNSSAYKLFDNEAHAVACYLRDQLHQTAQASQFDQLIAADNPDLSGGITFVKSQRHEVYLEAHSLKKYLRKLFRSLGWPEIEEGYYSSLRKGAGYVAVPVQQQKVAVTESFV